MHTESHPQAGQTVPIHLLAPHAQLRDPLTGEDLLDHNFVIEDWWDKMTGKSWGVSDGNPACLIYGMRIGFANFAIPPDDEVIYGKIGSFGHLIHQSEILPEGILVTGDDDDMQELIEALEDRDD